MEKKPLINTLAGGLAPCPSPLFPIIFDIHAHQGLISYMKKAILFICAISICLSMTHAFGEETTNPPVLDSTNGATTEQTYPLDDIANSEWWPAVWGKKARDAALLGMYSLHLDGTGQYWGNGSNNDQGHLAGARFYGLTAGTFYQQQG